MAPTSIDGPIEHQALKPAVSRAGSRPPWSWPTCWIEEEFSDEDVGLLLHGHQPSRPDRPDQGELRQRDARRVGDGDRTRLDAFEARLDFGAERLTETPFALPRIGADDSGADARRPPGESDRVLDFLLATAQEFAIVATPADGQNSALLETIASRFRRTRLSPRLGSGSRKRRPGVMPLPAGRPLKDGRATAYICERMTCQALVDGVTGLIGAAGA